MATNTDLKAAAAVVPDRRINDTSVKKIIYTNAFTTMPAAGDIIQLFDLPAGSHVLDASVRNLGVNGAVSSTIKLQQQAGTQTAQDLTASITASAASNARMTAAPYQAWPSVALTIQLLVGTASLVSASAGIEVFVNYEDNLDIL